MVASGAGGVEQLRTRLVEPLIARRLDVAVTLTPTAARWLEAIGEVDKIAALTGLPVRSRSRLPSQPRDHPRIDAYVAAPASANTIAKLALGIADNQALATLCENIASTPMVVFPRVNAAHARQPAWDRHIQALRSAGVHLIYGDDIWPLYEPREAPSDRELPWSAIIATMNTLLS